MSECSCSPLPTPTCNPAPTPSGSCNSIRMFFGYEPAVGNNIVPGQLDKLYYTPEINTSTIQNGFVIDNYSAKTLFDSGILPNAFSFKLTEKELLSTGSFPAWVSYTASTVFNTNPADETFCYKCLNALGIDMALFGIEAARMFVALKNGDGGAFYSTLYKALTHTGNILYKNLEHGICGDITEGIAIEKLEVCYTWMKNIADTYYGKQFLVKVAGPQQGQVFPGICIKDENGDSPSINVAASGAFYIEGDGSSQGYYTSDEISEGGFPKQCSGNILGLTKIDWIQNTDGKVAPFAKIGQISSTDISCPALQKQKIYKKFVAYSSTSSGGDVKCVNWTIDLAKLDSNNYHIEKEGENNYLYLKCEVENKFYVDKDGTWVNVVLSEKVPLVNADINPMLAIHDFVYLLTQPAQEITYKFLDQFFAPGGNTPLAGTRGSMTQLNLGTALPICLIPEGVVIPFKSNVYRYGPYYHVSNPDDGGGVDLVIEENIAPWNFIKAGDDAFPDDYPYCAMDKFGKELAKFTTKGLQKLEKGRVTVVGLPCHNIGSGLNTTGYDPTKEVGPTLLTDIGVDYGSGGFNTTYNFSTYSPRLGKSEKYLKEAWAQNLERTKYINSYLRSEKEKLRNIHKDYQKQLLNKNLFFTPLSKHKDSTPNRIVFSGYYLSDKDQDLAIVDIDQYTYTFDNNMPQDIECSVEPSSSVQIPSESPPSGIRRYTFSETDKGYTIEHVQKSYYQLAGMSLDGFYMPISLRGVNSSPGIKELEDNQWKNEARLPRFAMRCVDNSGSVQFKEWDSDDQLDIKSDPGYPIVSKNRDEIPPFQFIGDLMDPTKTTPCYALPIHQKYLNPYVSKQILIEHWTDGRKNSSDKGFVISSIVFGQDYTDYQIAHTDETEGAGTKLAGKEDELIRQQYKNFRVPAMRGPLVLQGWGYDTSGKPIPNAADNYINAEYGQFKRTGLKDKFLKDWLENPKTWPVGPVDLRFDRERGVWTCPSPNKIVVARLKEDLCKNGVAKAQLLNPEAGGIRFYNKYHISGPQGENIKLSMDRTEISVYDFIGENIKKCTKVYVYFDDNRYIVLKSEPPESIVRFRNIKLCETSPGDENPEKPKDYYGDNTWGAHAGYGDKYYNYHTYGIRIDCDGNPVDINGQLPDPEIEFNLEFIKNNAEDWLIRLQDNAGKFGPSLGKFINKNQWIEEASTGYAALISNDIKCVEPSASPSPPIECILGSKVECPLDDDIEQKLSAYDILFIESYARFLHGCLTQDLYVTSQEAATDYNEDTYKKAHPSGNAAIASGILYYGDSPNGQKPIFIDKDNIRLPIRVFDPWLDKNDNPLECYNPEKSIFYNATSGTNFTAVFNEKEKKYYIWQLNKKHSPIIRFKSIKLCLSGNTENIDDAYDQDWGRFAGYGDKYYNYHTYGVRIDCDGNIINRRGKKIPQDQMPPDKQFFIDNAKDWLVKLNDNAGKFGPSYSIFTNYEEWNDRASTGYASIVDNNDKDPSGCSLGSSSDCSIDQALESYDILFIESYARFLHGCLTQDLYVSNTKASELYSNDQYKLAYPSGNAAVTGIYYYGDSPNGREPIYLNENYQQLPIRIFDPWLDKDLNPISCYDPKDSIFYNATSGTAFTAIFDEKQKKYYLWQLNKKPKPSIVRFKLIEFCSTSSSDGADLTDKPDYGDDWTEYAGYMDKFPDRHILGVRIDCDGNPVDKDGKILTKVDFFTEDGTELIIDTNIEKAKNIFINILDTIGTHGPAYATYRYTPGVNNLNPAITEFNTWFIDASSGFGAVCEIPPEGNCNLGIHNDSSSTDRDQCVTTNPEFDTYEIIFLDTYARFVECTLLQDLYVTSEEAQEKYENDEYKKDHPEGNSSAELIDWYGDSPNGREPKFFKEGGEPTEFRVFDPFKDAPEDKNPFLKLKYGDRVLAIFNENLKKYVIWQALKREEKVIKFALTADKQVTDIEVTGVVVDQWGRPLDKKDKLIEDQEDFGGSFITIRDPYFSRASFAPMPNGNLGPNLTAFGPALGSNILQHHYDGIPMAPLAGGFGNQEYMPPFLGFALKRFLKNEEDEEVAVYEMFCLENYARYVKGKICTKLPDINNQYLATLGSFKEGIKPICRGIGLLPRGNLIIQHPLDQFTGVHSSIGGDLIAGAGDSSYANVDGCEFIALLDNEVSTTANLVYNIVESERFALEGKIKLKYQDTADTLNDNEFELTVDGEEMESEWYQGFMWNQANSQVNFEAMTILNREEWIDKGLFINGSIVTVYLSGFDINGNPIYSVDNGGTIARMVQRYVSNTNPGLFGLPAGLGGAPNIDRKILGSDDFADGLDPSIIDDANKPKIDMSDDQQWMTYDQGIVTGLWDETLDANGKVSNCKYKIIYAQEAPVIITGKAESEFTPVDIGAVVKVQIADAYVSCQGIDRDPIPEVLQNVENPMGHGAKQGDWVTIQRVFIGAPSPQQANYKYIVIGTGHPPGDLK